MKTEDPRLEALFEAILPPNAPAAPCPLCGRSPRLIVGECLSWYVCGPWWRSLLGLRPHIQGPTVFEGWNDGDYARRAAANAWNKMVNRQSRRPGSAP
jgi:hypothetical protein